MTVHARRIASIPSRTATETWHTICDLVSEPGTKARHELDAIKGIASALITEEYTRVAPVIVSGTGVQVRIYTLHGDDAIDADPFDETPLTQYPTQGGWRLSLPCGAYDLDEAIQATTQSTHVEVRSLEEATAASTGDAIQAPLRPAVDLSALERL